MTTSQTHLVIGGSGFLGSHVTRQLLLAGQQVRVWTRSNSSTRAFADLPVEHVLGELSDVAGLRFAMRGVAAVHYCVVDARAWCRDPAALRATNVDGLRTALDAAVETSVPAFVFCSTVGTVGRASGAARATEESPHDWLHLGGPYISSRVEAERLALSYHHQYELPVTALLVSTTYGPHDYAPTPHGRVVSAAAHGKLPFYIRDQLLEVVGVEDAARAFVLAALKGRPGERYLISDRMISNHEIALIAANAAGAKPPRVGVPFAFIKAVGVAGSLVATCLDRDVVMSRTTVRLMRVMSAVDTAKAQRELGWKPRPVEQAIAEAARFYVDHDIR